MSFGRSYEQSADGVVDLTDRQVCDNQPANIEVDPGSPTPSELPANDTGPEDTSQPVLHEEATDTASNLSDPRPAEDVPPATDRPPSPTNPPEPEKAESGVRDTGTADQEAVGEVVEPVGQRLGEEAISGYGEIVDLTDRGGQSEQEPGREQPVRSRPETAIDLIIQPDKSSEGETELPLELEEALQEIQRKVHEDGGDLPPDDRAHLLGQRPVNAGPIVAITEAVKWRNDQDMQAQSGSSSESRYGSGTVAVISPERAWEDKELPLASLIRERPGLLDDMITHAKENTVGVRKEVVDADLEGFMAKINADLKKVTVNPTAALKDLTRLIQFRTPEEMDTRMPRPHTELYVHRLSRPPHRGEGEKRVLSSEYTADGILQSRIIPWNTRYCDQHPRIYISQSTLDRIYSMAAFRLAFYSPDDPAESLQIAKSEEDTDEGIIDIKKTPEYLLIQAVEQAYNITYNEWNRQLGKQGATLDVNSQRPEEPQILRDLAALSISLTAYVERLHNGDERSEAAGTKAVLAKLRHRADLADSRALGISHKDHVAGNVGDVSNAWILGQVELAAETLVLADLTSVDRPKVEQDIAQEKRNTLDLIGRRGKNVRSDIGSGRDSLPLGMPQQKFDALTLVELEGYRDRLQSLLSGAHGDHGLDENQMHHAALYLGTVQDRLALFEVLGVEEHPDRKEIVAAKGKNAKAAEHPEDRRIHLSVGRGGYNAALTAALIALLNKGSIWEVTTEGVRLSGPTRDFLIKVAKDINPDGRQTAFPEQEPVQDRTVGHWIYGVLGKTPAGLKPEQFLDQSGELGLFEKFGPNEGFYARLRQLVSDPESPRYFGRFSLLVANESWLTVRPFNLDRTPGSKTVWVFPNSEDGTPSSLYEYMKRHFEASDQRRMQSQ